MDKKTIEEENAEIDAENATIAAENAVIESTPANDKVDAVGELVLLQAKRFSYSAFPKVS
jgi:hypothetical protein